MTEKICNFARFFERKKKPQIPLKQGNTSFLNPLIQTTAKWFEGTRKSRPRRTNNQKYIRFSGRNEPQARAAARRMACRSWRWSAEPCPCHTRPRPPRPSPLPLLSPQPKEREEATGSKASTFLVPLAPLFLPPLSPPCPCFLHLYQWQGFPTPTPLDNHPGSRERREERGRETGSGGCLVIYGSHSSEYWVKLGNGRGEKTGRWKGREVGDQERTCLWIANNYWVACGCNERYGRSGQQKQNCLFSWCGFGTGCHKICLFLLWVFRSFLSSGCGDKIWSFVSIYRQGTVLCLFFVLLPLTALLSNISFMVYSRS